MEGLLLFVLLFGGAVVGWRMFLMVFRPEVWLEQEHQRKEKRQAVLGLAVNVLSRFFGGK